MAGELTPEDQALLDKIRGRQALDGAAVRATAQQADQFQGDTFAAQRRVAGRLGLPVEAVVNTWPESHLEDKANSAAQVAGKHPVLQQLMLDPDFVRLVHDDTDALGAFVDGASAVAKYLTSHPSAKNTLAGDVGAGVFGASRGAAGVGQAAAELAAPLLDPLERYPGLGGNPLRRLAEGFAMQGAAADAQRKALSPAQPGVVAGGVSSGVQSLTQNLLTLPLAFLPGGQAAALAGMSAQTGGDAYQQGREQGMPMSQALPFAASQAAIEYATEVIPLATLLKNLKGGTSLVRTALTNAAQEAPGEQVATLLQDLNEWAVLPENKDKPFSAYLEERPSAAAQTLIATLIGVGGNVAVGHSLTHVLGAAAIDAEKAHRAENSAATLTELMKLQAAMKLHERAPDVSGGLMQALAEGTDGAPTEVRFDARTLVDALQQAGVEPAQIARVLPTAAAGLAEAVAAGGEVAVPVGEFSQLAGTPLEQVLLQHARIGDNELSQAEAKEASSKASADVQAKAEEVLAQASQDDAARASAEAVRQRVFDELQKAGRFTADVNTAYAALHAAFFATMAQRTGTTAEELFNRHALKVQATSPVGEAYRDAGLPGAINVEGYHFSKRAGRTDPSLRVEQVFDTSSKQPAIEITPAMREKVLAGVPLFQDQQPAAPSSGSSARALFTPGANAITLLQGADLSSFLHESGHFFLEVLTDIGSRTDAPADVARDVDTLMKWFGTTLPEWQQLSISQKRKHHERFAESFEQYLLEGKAPSTELRPVFRRFRAWMLNVYRSLKDFLDGRKATPGGAPDGLGLSDEVRAVFDRMLAVDAAIKEAEATQHLVPAFREKPAGMTDVAWQAYQVQAEAVEEGAVDKLQARSLRDLRWLANARSRRIKEMQAQVKNQRKAVMAEVAAEVDAMPVYQAMRWLRKGEMTTAEGEEIKAEKGFRLSTAALAEMYPDTALDNPDLGKLKGLTAANGLHPDVVAGMFGYTSGDQLVRTIIDAEPRTSVIEGMTDQRMLERHGDVSSPEGLARAVDEALHDEARGRFLATELAALRDGVASPKLTSAVDSAVAKADRARSAAGRKVAGPTPRVLAKAAREFGRQLAGRRKVRELKPGLHAAAETRAAKAAEKALAAGDMAAAAQAKQDQLLQHYANKASAEALDQVERGREYLKKFDKAVLKGLDQEYTDQIHKLLERVDLRKQSNTALDRRAKLAAWIAEQEDLGIEPDIPDYLLEDAQLTSYRDMTVEQFLGLLDTVRQIEHLGRLKNKLLTAQDQREFAAIVQTITDGIVANAGNRKGITRTPADTLGRALKGLRSFGAAHIKAATWARIMDGGKDGGPVWEYFVRSANERGDWETERIAKATADLTSIMQPLLDAAKLGGKGTWFPSIGSSLNKEQVLAIALNTGNDGNLQRLLGGEGWTLDQLQPVLATLTPADWKAVQSIWDYFETFRPEIGAKEKRVFGKEPEWIEPGSPVTDAQGLRGGYYPIKYDPSASGKAEQHASAEEAKAQLKGAYNAATTRRSFTKSRAEEVVGRPLLYTLAGVYTGVQDVIHDLAWHEWLIDTNRLLRNQAIDSTIRKRYGPEVVGQFKSWRDDIAAGNQGANSALEMALGRLRQSVSVAGLGFNVVSALMQPLGFTQSVVRIGAKWVGKGVMRSIANPAAAARKTNEMSSFMRSRSRTRLRELNELRNRVQGQSGVQRVISENAYRLMMGFQQLVDVPTWLGAYEKAVADGNDDKRAVALADQAVIDAQGGGQAKDLAAIERGGPALKLFTTFYSFMNTAANLGAAQAMTSERSAAGRAKLAADMLLLYTVPAVLGALLKDAITPGDSGDDDWEKLARKLLAEQLSFLMGLFVVGREFGQVATTVTGAGQPRDYAGPPGLRAIGDAYKFSTQAAQGEFDDSFRKAAVNLLGDIFGLPSAQLNRSITGTQALVEGQTQNPAAVLLGYQEPR